MLRRVLFALACLTLVACTDEGPILFPPAEGVVPLLEGTPGGQVGTTIHLGPLFILEDRYGNRVPGVAVPVDVVRGDGALADSLAVSDAQGRILAPAFTLDTIAGTNRLRFSPRGLGAYDIEIEGTPGPLRRLIPGNDSTFLGEAEVGTALPTPVSARFTDAYGNPIRNAPITFLPLAGGGVAGEGGAPGQPSASIERTDADGWVSILWTLGDRPGLNRIAIRSDILPSRIHDALAVVGPLEALAPQTPPIQTSQISEVVVFPPRVRAQDRLENPLEGVEVTFEVTSGGGTVSPEVVVTDSTGIAAVSEWTMGPDVGEQTLTATTGSITTTFTANAGISAPGPQLRIDAVHVNQGAQTLAGGIDLVGGRDGLLRVFVSSPDSLELQPEIEVELFSDGVLIERYRLSAGSSRVLPILDPDRLDRSWNVELPGSIIQPGLGVRATLDPDGELNGTGQAGYVYPESGGIASVQVRHLNPVEIVLIPILQEANGLLGQVSENNADDLLSLTRRIFPLEELAWRIRTPYVTQIELINDFQRWAELVNELLALRIDEEDGDAFYYGVAQVEYTTGIAGIGFIPPSPDRPEKVSVGWDRPNTAAYIAAHELGHNMGRRHAPCGGPSGVDQSYPHSGARIGSPGWDIEAGELRSTASHRDIMSYCRPEWSSDYTFGALLEWIEQLRPPAMMSTVPQDGIMIWGRVSNRGLYLEPAFASHGPPSLPDRAGPLRVVGLSIDSETLFDLSFEGVPVDHAPDPSERHFAFRVPLTPTDRDRLHRIELRRGSEVRSAESSIDPRTPAALRIDPPAPEVKTLPDGRVRLEWDAAARPLAVVRDRDGAIRTIARGGSAQLSATGESLTVELSDGVRSLRYDLPLPD
ncbi:MAG: hypothetical protein EA351_14480 [Gemmatimonadales bacterium]|nr:MAG: hypothetical protein EA351_14480 [Gemmatimonadales bacterium]